MLSLPSKAQPSLSRMQKDLFLRVKPRPSSRIPLANSRANSELYDEQIRATP